MGFGVMRNGGWSGSVRAAIRRAIPFLLKNYLRDGKSRNKAMVVNGSAAHRPADRSAAAVTHS